VLREWGEAGRVLREWGEAGRVSSHSQYKFSCQLCSRNEMIVSEYTKKYMVT